MITRLFPIVTFAVIATACASKDKHAEAPVGFTPWHEATESRGSIASSSAEPAYEPLHAPSAALDLPAPLRPVPPLQDNDESPDIEGSEEEDDVTNATSASAVEAHASPTDEGSVSAIIEPSTGKPEAGLAREQASLEEEEEEEEEEEGEDSDGFADDLPARIPTNAR